MLKVYFADSYYKVDGEEWGSCGKRGYVMRDDAQPDKQIYLDKAGWDAACAAELDGLVCGKTIFRKRPYLDVSRGWFDDHPRRFYWGDFKEFSYVVIYTEWTTCPLSWIMEKASAEQTIQYMKERGMTVCPMQ